MRGWGPADGRTQLPLTNNRWPEGKRRLPCIRCGRMITSRSKTERYCHNCRRSNEEGPHGDELQVHEVRL